MLTAKKQRCVKECPNRHVGCQANCEILAAQKREREAVKKHLRETCIGLKYDEWRTNRRWQGRYKF